MSIQIRCPKCGDIIGVTIGFSGVVRREKPDMNAPCKGTHGIPVKKTVDKELGGLIEITRTDYPNGSSSPLVKQYVGPDSGWKFLVLCIYVIVFRNTVHGNEWIRPGFRPNKIRNKVGKLEESKNEQPKTAEH